jgi:hypothetical protein
VGCNVLGEGESLIMVDIKGTIKILGFPQDLIEDLNKTIFETRKALTDLGVEVIIVVGSKEAITEPRIVITCFEASTRLMLEPYAENFLKIILADPRFKDRQLEYSASCTFKAVEGQSTQKSPAVPQDADNKSFSDAAYCYVYV